MGNTKQELITAVSAGFVGQQKILAEMSVGDLMWVNANPIESMNLFVNAVENRRDKVCKNILLKKIKYKKLLWQKGLRKKHKVVENYDGTISVWLDCIQIDWSQPNHRLFSLILRTEGQDKYINLDIVAEMPRVERLTILHEIVFFKSDHFLSSSRLEQEFRQREVSAVDPFLLVKINEIFPEFMNKYPNGTQWQNKHGEWCNIIFRSHGHQSVVVDWSDNGNWSNIWWFGGLRR